MEKIFIYCGIGSGILLIATVIIDSFKSFQAGVLYFILILEEHKNHSFVSLFLGETETIEDFVSSKPGLSAQMFSSFFKKEMRDLLKETEGFQREVKFFKDSGQYKKASEVNELRNANIAKIYIALGCPQL